MKAKELFFICMLLVFSACGGDDNDDVIQPPQQPVVVEPTVKVSAYLQEIRENKYVEASFVKTSLGTLAGFYTDFYKDANGKEGRIEILGRVSGSFTEQPETKGDIQLSEIAIQRIYGAYETYWKIRSYTYGVHKYQGGTVKYTKNTDGTYHVVLQGGPLVDDKNDVIDQLMIEYDGMVSIGNMLEY